MLSAESQYRWFNFDYQVGVFISRSSVNVIKFNRVWLMAVFQAINVVYFLSEALWEFTPSVMIIFAAILWEGLLGGGAYVNTFYRMSKEIPENRRNFAMGVVPVSDAIGIAFAGLAAIPTHNQICNAFYSSAS